MKCISHLLTDDFTGNGLLHLLYEQEFITLSDLEFITATKRLQLKDKSISELTEHEKWIGKE